MLPAGHLSLLPWFPLLSCIAEAIAFLDRCRGKHSFCFSGQTTVVVNINVIVYLWALPLRVPLNSCAQRPCLKYSIIRVSGGAGESPGFLRDMSSDSVVSRVWELLRLPSCSFLACFLLLSGVAIPASKNILSSLVGCRHPVNHGNSHRKQSPVS